MAYAQRNYNELQGINGKYRINQIGCFLTAFCNLLERFGRGVDPLVLNRAFRDRGVYIDVDDGIRDDLGWQSIIGYDGQINVSRTGTGEIPSNNVIVRIKAGNRFGTHFCLVQDRRDGRDPLVIDSFDGVVKPASAYGPVTGWAEYTDAKPQPVTPIINAPTGPNYDGESVTVQVGWGISHAAEAAGWPDADKDVRWNAIAQLNGHADYTTFRLVAGQRIKVGKYVAPTPAVVEPPKQPEQPQPVETKEHTVDVKVSSFKDTLEPAVIKEYVAVEDVIVNDAEGLQVPLKLSRGQTVHAESLFKKDGVEYVRTKKSTENDWWYGIPLTILRPKGTIDDVDDDDLFSLDMQDEAHIVFNTLSLRERIVVFLARTHAFFVRLFTFWKRKK